MGELIEHLKPNFFIPGAAKSGTTTLHDMLNTHPEISMSSVKEPGYWKNKNFKEFGNTEMHNYQNLFDNTKKFKGESSTAYMYHDSFINNVKNNYKEPPKFIFILRNPIDRYFSHVNWMKGLGLEKNNLDEIINNGSEFNFKEYDDYPKYYYEFGLYNRWINRFLDNFGKDNIKIITFEELLKNKLSTLNECFDFIGVSLINEIKEKVDYLNLKSSSSESELTQFNFWFGIDNSKLNILLKTIEKITSENKLIKIQIFSRSGVYE